MYDLSFQHKDSFEPPRENKCANILKIERKRDGQEFIFGCAPYTDLCVPYWKEFVRKRKKQGDKTKKIMSNEGGSQWIKDHELDFEKWLTFPPEDTLNANVNEF